MAKYKLLSQHYSEEDKLLEVDTIVGDGTEHVWTRRPTPQMEPLDESARQAVETEMIRARERGIPWHAGQIAPLDDLPLTMEEADAKYEREVAAASEPPEPPRQFRSAPTLADRARR